MTKMSLAFRKKLPALLRGKTSTNNRNFYCMNCLHLFQIECKLQSHDQACRYKYYSHLEMPENKILKDNYSLKSMRVLFVICADTFYCVHLKKQTAMKIFQKNHSELKRARSSS